MAVGPQTLTAERWHEIVSNGLESHGLDSASECGQVVQEWLLAELQAGLPEGWADALSTALDTAVVVYDRFNAVFAESFLLDRCRGEAWVRRNLRAAFGYADAVLVEAVLATIRDKRLVLMQSIRRKYQPAFFGPVTFQPNGVRGYLRRVARVESLKAPLDELGRVGDAATLARLQAPGFAPDSEVGDTPAGPGARADLVKAFWCEKSHKFERSQYLEGMATLCLGALTGSKDLEARCAAYLVARYPDWLAAQDRVTERVERALYRRGLLEEEYRRIRDEDVRERLERLQRKLTAMQLRLRRHRDKLLPRPRDVAELLAGLVTQQVGSVRFKRIGREIDMLRNRVDAAIGHTIDPSADPVAAVVAHLSGKPPSAGAHGIPDTEREARRQAERVWLSDAEGVLVRVYEAIRGLSRDATAEGGALRGWLHDVQDYYEFGVLDRVGVVGALRVRRGTRLKWLLRSAEPRDRATGRV